MLMRPHRIALAAALALGAATPATHGEVTIDSNSFGGLEVRAIGPAVMGGRIAAIDGVAKEPLTLYVGSASGGVWKSTDGGVSFKPVFDEHTQSIGAVTVDPGNPDTVWVGTGESCTRNSASVGTGVYKTTDGGKTWKQMGLASSERIADVWVHPQDGKVVLVCATGHLWDDHEERGVYKTTDGGETWKRVLYVDAKTGCSDLAGDSQDPSVLYAGMWQFRRYPDFFHSGGAGSGLYKSTDGGETWVELVQGLPAGDKGRIAVAVAPSRPSVVYALIEAEKTALYRSDDLGGNFQEVNSSFNVKVRPFYFSHLVVDPTDWKRVYKPGLILAVSEDAGKSFTSPFGGGFGGGGVHGDHHALWVNPERPQELFLGTDGGVYQSHDRASHWRFVATLPVSQFYHVSVDMDVPYNVLGGLQDNGSWMGPSASLGGVESRDWENIGFGDGFWAFRDPADPNFVYVEYQGGNISRVRLLTREARDIKPQPGAGDPEYRFNWNAPIHLSPNEPGTVYLGGQHLFRSRDRGESWEKISPDLTTNDPKLQRQKQSGGLTIDNSTAENHTTIYAISESPKDGAVIWAGTDDGNLQVTRDGGRSWTNVVGNVPGLPAGTWVSSVAASPHDAATAFATFDGHRRGDMKPYAYRTTDHGATWQSLATDGVEGFAWVLKQDLVDADLLFLGTEFGLYVSVDAGRQWARFTGNLPKVAVHDVAIHPRDGDLVLATHGRGVYILDDLTPLRHLGPETVDSEVALLPSRPAVMYAAGGLQEFGGDDEFVGRNPPEAATITYYLKKRHLFGDLKIEIHDGEGKLISTIPGGKRKGLNRVLWPMRLPPPKVPPASSLAPAFVGPRVLEGTYTVRLIKGNETVAGQVQLVADPRSPHSPEDRAVQQRLALRLYGMLEELTYVVETSVGVRDQARERAKGLAKGDKLAKTLEDLAKAFDDFRGGLVATSEAGWLSGDEKLREWIAGVYSGVTSYDGMPTQTQLDRTEVLAGQLEAAAKRFESLAGTELARANEALAKKGQPTLEVKSREEWKAGEER
jgi:photosystem II stability/assembly factor-like uncharacterized protein